MKKKMISISFAMAMLLSASMAVWAAPAVSGNDVSGNDISGNDISGNNVTTTISGNDEILRPTDGSNQIVFKGEVETVHLTLTITQSGRIIANPYGLTNSSLGLNANTTLTPARIKFENKSDAALSVGLTGAIKLYYDGVETTEDQIKIAAENVAGPTGKQLYVQGKISDGNRRYLTTAQGGIESPIIYSEKGTTAESAPVLAAKGMGGKTSANGQGTTTDTIVLELSGSTSYSKVSEWKKENKFDVITIYDIRLSEADMASGFIAE